MGDDLDDPRRRHDAAADAAAEAEQRAAGLERLIADIEHDEAERREAQQRRDSRTAETVAAEYAAAVARLELAAGEALADYRAAVAALGEVNDYRRQAGQDPLSQPLMRQQLGAALEAFARYVHATKR